MKSFQNKTWAKILAWILCLFGAFGTLFCTLILCIVGGQPKKSELLDYCYNSILMNYAYEIMDEMDIDDPDWEESLEKYSEKNWNFAILVESGNGIATKDQGNPDNYVYISNAELLDRYDYSWDASNLTHFQYNTSSLLSILFGETYQIWDDDFLYENRTILYVVMDQNTGVLYAATVDGYMAMQDVCVQTQNGTMRDFLRLEVNEDNEPYYILDSTGERQTASDILSYQYISEICNRYQDYPLYIETDPDVDPDDYEENHIYLMTTNEIYPRYYKGDISISHYDDTQYSYVTYASEEATYTTYFFFADVNDELVYDDEIAQITKIIDVAYSLAGADVFILLGCVLVFLFGLSSLFYSAGRRSVQEGIPLSIIDKIPFELLTCVGAGIYIGLLFLFMLLFETEFVLGDVASLLLAAMLFAAAVVVAVLYLVSIAARIKAKRFWKNTIIYFLGKKLIEICRLVGRNLPLFGKCLLVMVALGIGEVIALLICWEAYWDFEIQILVVLLWTVVETVIVFFFCYQMKVLQKGIAKVAEGDLHEKVDTSRLFWEFKKHGEMINKAGEGITAAVEKQMKSERFRTELITNVSHDIKTPLTSIINYVDLIQKEDIQNENLQEYIEVLDRQSNRLKKLIEDLMEASKASTGNLPVQMEDCDVSVLLTQLIGEYEEKLSDRNLELVVQNIAEPVMVKADGRYLWRVFDNLMNNIRKYALEGTRVYLSMEKEIIGKDTMVRITFRNISRQQLNISSEELMERFVRGDSSRNTEGSGLGLSIAQSLTILMKGKMELFVDGDLFKVILTFPIIPYHNPSQEQSHSSETFLLEQPEKADELSNKKD